MVDIFTAKKITTERDAWDEPFPSDKGPLTIAHLSDLHIACTGSLSWRQLLNKRILGYLRWKLGRSKEFDYRILAILEQELQQIRADQTIITGDLTHLGLPQEFKKVAMWLSRVGKPDDLLVLPGNHDTYVRMPWAKTFFQWQAYAPYSFCKDKSPSALQAIFPVVRVRKAVALIGLATAAPSPWHLATGKVGRGQLERLESILQRTRQRGLFQVLAIHHPPAPAVVDKRKELVDAGELLQLIEKHGCGLVLHGHSHLTSLYFIKGPAGQIPVVEAPSALSVSPRKERRAKYFIFEISRQKENYWMCKMEERVFKSYEQGFAKGKIRHFYLRL